MELDAQMGEVLSALVWFLFGALMLPFVLDATSAPWCSWCWR